MVSWRQTGRVDSCLIYFFYTFNQAPIGTNTTTVLLRVSVGLLTVLPLWKCWLMTKLCHVFALFYCFMIWQLPSVHSARLFVFILFVLCLLMKKRENWGVGGGDNFSWVFKHFVISSTRNWFCMSLVHLWCSVFYHLIKVIKGSPKKIQL